MKLDKIISKSKDGNRMEVIARDDFQNMKTLHIQQHSKKWRYCAGHQNDQPILRSIELKDSQGGE